MTTVQAEKVDEKAPFALMIIMPLVGHDLSDANYVEAEVKKVPGVSWWSSGAGMGERVIEFDVWTPESGLAACSMAYGAIKERGYDVVQLDPGEEAEVPDNTAVIQFWAKKPGDDDGGDDDGDDAVKVEVATETAPEASVDRPWMVGAILSAKASVSPETLRADAEAAQAEVLNRVDGEISRATVGVEGAQFQVIEVLVNVSSRLNAHLAAEVAAQTLEGRGYVVVPTEPSRPVGEMAAELHASEADRFVFIGLVKGTGIYA